MTTYETPRDGTGAKLCHFCGGPIRQSGVGRSKDYCSRLCREKAYRARRTQRIKDEAVAAALESGLISSTGETRPDPVSPVDETEVPQVSPEISAPAAPAPAPAPRGRGPLDLPQMPKLWR
ncbi:hypothetical protein AB0B15_42925 [Streptomyces sp. NPDC045456]|uniref:hypothetical protein n=1 Tax=Streptomyces sp. NPDC045456 TaxID=3155254 RepID=UPI0033C000CB